MCKGNVNETASAVFAICKCKKEGVKSSEHQEDSGEGELNDKEYSIRYKQCTCSIQV